MLCCCSPKKSDRLVRGWGVQSPPKRVVFRFHEAFAEGEPGSLGFADHFSPATYYFGSWLLESSWKSGCWGSIWWRSPMRKNRRSGFLGNFWMNQWMNQVCAFTFRYTLSIFGWRRHLFFGGLSYDWEWRLVILGCESLHLFLFEVIGYLLVSLFSGA